MSSKKIKFKDGLAYSTNPEYRLENHRFKELISSHNKDEGRRLIISRSTKGRHGKTVTLISGFSADADMNNIAKLLRNKCGVGGSVKENDIILQGEVREKAAALLRKEGFSVVISG